MSTFTFFSLIVPDIVNEDCSTGDIRLTDGSTQYEGRVEVCFNGVWGAICDSHWTDIEASTACKTLGHQPYGIIIILFRS